MSCEPLCPCGCGAPALVLDPPPPGETHLRRRVGEFYGFVGDLIAAVERQTVDGERLGSSWDIAADPAGLRIARLWGYVAESVAAYSELTAGEGYLPTAQDWTDLRRVAGLVGFKPRPPIAAEGYVMADIDKATDPLVPAGTRVQSPAGPGQAAQTFEVVVDTQLYAEWAGLTATWVPQPAVPTDRTLRFLGDPGFSAADRVLFVLEEQPGLPVAETDWFGYWGFVIDLWSFSWDYEFSPASATPLALAGVRGTSSELGTSVVAFDRDLDKLLPTTTDPYAAYRVLATAATARRVESVLQIPASGSTVNELSLTSLLTTPPIATDAKSIIVDRPLEDLSAHKLVAVVDWTANACDVVELDAHSFVDWEVAPGTPTRVSKLTFASKVPTLANAGANPVTVYVLDRRVVARHYVLPAVQPAGPAQLRLYPPPVRVPDLVTVGIAATGDVDWQVYACAESVDQETTGDGAPSGLVVDLPDDAPTALSIQAPASANLLRVHHGKTTSVVLGSGNATQSGQSFVTPNAPIASDLDDTGSPVPSMLLRVAGVRWDEVPSLYGEGSAEVFATRLGADGSETVQFGDGLQGARLPTGSGNVTTTYRVGGGVAGEVASGAIDTLLGSVRGVKKVRGAGPTEGGADQDQESSLRRLAPARARAFGRAVSAEDLVDLSLGYPGVTHAATWEGDGPPGCACGASGLHLAFIRTGTSGPRPPLAAEIDSLAGYLDSRRDLTVPLCVCAGIVTRPQLTAALATDPRRDAATVAVAVAVALADPDGELGPDQRFLGQPLDRSDVFAVIHDVAGVVGVASLDLPGANAELGRRGALSYELLAPSTDPVVTGASA